MDRDFLQGQVLSQFVDISLSTVCGHQFVDKDVLTRSGSFAFLHDLFDIERLFELRDFHITRVMPKGETVEQFAASMHLVLDLSDKYPRDSLVCTHSGHCCAVSPGATYTMQSLRKSKTDSI